MQTNVQQKRADQQLPVDEREEGSAGWRDYKGCKKTFSGNRYVHFLDHSDGICQKLSNFTLSIHETCCMSVVIP